MNSLEYAVVCGDHAKVKTLLDKGADPNIVGNNNETPLHRAVVAGHHAIVETLLANGADPNIPGSFGYTPLHRAAANGHHAIVKTLLDNGANPDLKHRNGWTALQFAADHRHRHVYNTLLPKTHQPDWDSLLPKFIVTACSGWPDQRSRWHDQIVAALANGADPNILRSNDCTPLHCAAAYGQHDIIMILLDNGADPNLKDKAGRTALQFAANHRHRREYNTLLPKTHQPDWNRMLVNLSRSGWKDQVDAALINGADPNIPDDYHDTALHRAAANGHHAIVKTLLDNGADPKLKGKNGSTALENAVMSGRLDVYKTLLAVTHQPDWNRLLPEFSRSGWKDQVEAALINGADPNIPDDHHGSVLHLAAAYGHRDIVETLLVNGADPTLKNRDGWKAWQCARTVVMKDVIQNFMSVPHSLQLYCRACIRGRLIKCLPDHGLPIKEAVATLQLPLPIEKYVYQTLSL